MNGAAMLVDGSARGVPRLCGAHLALAFDQPWALLALCIPLAVLWLARSRARPVALFTGAFALWRPLAADAASARRRPRIPPPIVLFALSLALAVLALAGPRPSDASGPRLRVVVDRSPSMYLADGGATRLERALAAVLELARARGVDTTDATAIEWIDASARPARITRAATLPPGWLLAPRAPRETPRWSEHDAPGIVWLTDDASSLSPARASVVASGGPGVPGFTGAASGRAFDWDGAQLVERASAPRSRVRVLGVLDPELTRLVTAWASARAIDLDASPSAGDVELTIRAAPVNDGEPASIGRDGWSATARCGEVASEDAELGALDAWLSAPGSGSACVAATRGRIEIALSGVTLTSGADAPFAVSWSALLDGCVLPLEGAVSATERADAGVLTIVNGDARPFRDGGDGVGAERDAPRGARWTTTLATGALALVLAALVWGLLARR